MLLLDILLVLYMSKISNQLNMTRQKTKLSEHIQTNQCNSGDSLPGLFLGTLCYAISGPVTLISPWKGKMSFLVCYTAKSIKLEVCVASKSNKLQDCKASGWFKGWPGLL